MFKHSTIIVTILLLIAIGCAAGRHLPGTGGKSSAQKIESGHPDVPEGVNCYTCHKNEIPKEEFHKKYGVTCDKCHGKTTWLAFKYPHEAWPLGVHRKMRCNQCHNKMEIYDFSAWQCWGCHHEEKNISESHKKLGIDNINNCVDCHKGSKLSGTDS